MGKLMNNQQINQKLATLLYIDYNNLEFY